MNKDAAGEGPPLPPLISDRCVSSLIHKLISLGYFHANVDVEPPHEEPREYTIESTRAARLASSGLERYAASDDGCGLILRTNETGIPGCSTRSALACEVAEAVRRAGGRASIEEVAATLAVEESDVERAAVEHGQENDFAMVGREIISEQHLDALAEEVDMILESDGQVVVSEIAKTVYRTPVDFCLSSLTDRMAGGKGKNQIIRSDARLTTGGGAGSARKEIVTARYDDERAAELTGMLRGMVEPTSLDGLIEELGWDDTTAVRRVRAMCDDGTLMGEVHGGGIGGVTGTEMGAVYVPHIYATMQRRGVDDFFAVNGYITSEMCASLGILKSRMGDYVKESFPDAIELTDAVINPDVIVSPLEAVVQEGKLSNSFVDFRTTLPEALVASENDMKRILQDFVLPNINESDADGKQDSALDGVSVIADGEALWCSRGMIMDIEAKILPPLIESYGKSRAEEIEEETFGTAKKKKAISNEEEGEIIMTGGKMKKSGRRGERKGKQDDGRAATDGKKVAAKDKRRGRKGAAANSCIAEPTAGVVPLVLVAKRLAEEYPDLLDVQENYVPLFDLGDDDAPRWERVDDEENALDGGTDGGGPLYELCRLALYTSTFRDACARAVKAELDKIASTKHGISVGGRKEGAAKVRSIESAFEDAACFPAACHLIQMLAKLPSSLCNIDYPDTVVAKKLEHDFLTGCAADFTRRITEYCLFKNQVEDDIFVFESEHGSSCTSAGGKFESGLPSFCHPVNTAARSFGHSYMLCSPDGDGKPRDPLPTLREILPGNIGVSLARMWALCGGECYDGGKRIADDGSEYIRRGNMDEFLKHTEESCLTICGIPFKLLDKKAEKQAMFARRHELSQLLENSSDGKDVLEYSIMLLFQQAKSIAVAGDELASAVLDLLSNEKKVPQPVASKLKELAECLRGNGDVGDYLISTVKECGLSRDVSRHVLSI